MLAGKRAFAGSTASDTIAAIISGDPDWNSAQGAVTRWTVDVGRPLDVSPAGGAGFVLSRDGRRIAFVSENRLFTRRVDQVAAQELAGTEGAFGPFFSPDASWLGFFTNDKLKKVSIETGAVVTLCDAPSGRGGTWGTDDVIVASLTATAGLWKIAAAGGTPEAITTVKKGETSHRWPQLLPDGQSLVFTANTRPFDYDNATIQLLTLTDGQMRLLQEHGTFGGFVGTAQQGYLTFLRYGTLYAMPFDPVRGRIQGAAVPVIEGIAHNSSLAGRTSQCRTMARWSISRIPVSMCSGWNHPAPRRSRSRASATTQHLRCRMTGNESRSSTADPGDERVHGTAAHPLSPA
jgi:hypothetical protein